MNNNSKVLALKYRPQIFEDLIGQEIVAETIINSIKADKIPNAYLFTGIRGIGKTTIARIVSKALNCSNGIEKICKEMFKILKEGGVCVWVVGDQTVKGNESGTSFKQALFFKGFCYVGYVMLGPKKKTTINLIPTSFKKHQNHAPTWMEF